MDSHDIDEMWEIKHAEKLIKKYSEFIKDLQDVKKQIFTNYFLKEPSIDRFIAKYEDKIKKWESKLSMLKVESRHYP